MFTSSISQYPDIFKLVREIPVFEVARRYLSDELRRQGSRWVTTCPFHREHSPSLVLYENGWKCFGCQAHGDGVDLVAKLCNLRPLKAAMEIARAFGLDTGQGAPIDRGAVLQFQREQKEKQKIEAAFREWRKRTFNGLAIYLRACENILAGRTDQPGYAAACHLQPKLEYLFEVLSGPEEDQVAFFKEYEREWILQ